MNASDLKKAMEWWELSLTSEKRGEYLNKYLPGRESITDKEILCLWEDETGRGELGDSSIGELDGEKWELYGNLIATNNKTEAICELVGQLNPKFKERAALIASAPALKKENERLREQVAEYINLLKLAYGSLETFTESEAWEEHSDGITLSAIEKAIESTTK